jgi:GNAT superfamily N-acetyltransferase
MLCGVTTGQVTDRHKGFRVERFGPALRGDFDRLHSVEHGTGWCWCVAWWVPTWEGWGARAAEDNAALRERLCDAGEYDGLLAYAGDLPVGWCQLGPRDRLAKLVDQLALDVDASAWAVTCFLVAPTWRRRGVATALLAEAIAVARAAGASRLEGYPRTGGTVADGEAWTGSEAVFTGAGFVLARADEPRSVYAMPLV